MNRFTRIARKAALRAGVHISRADADYDEDGIRLSKLNTSFLDNTNFKDAWQFATDGNREAWRGNPPAIRWRAHIALWAARNGLRLEGDFVECGVFAGVLSMTICKALNFQNVPKKFYLIDSYEGLSEESGNQEFMGDFYRGAYDIAAKNFAAFPNAVLVKGYIPEILSSLECEKVSYLSIDLNSAIAELAAMEFFWDKLSPGACVVFDDYGWTDYRDQHDALDAFAAARGVMIATLPTHQGLLIKPPA